MAIPTDFQRGKWQPNLLYSFGNFPLNRPVHLVMCRMGQLCDPSSSTWHVLPNLGDFVDSGYWLLHSKLYAGLKDHLCDNFHLQI